MSRSVCAVIGAGPGLGAAVARRFGREGFHVALMSRGRERLEGLRQELAGEAIESSVFPVDASRPDDVSLALAEVAGTIGAPEVLIYNAAVLRPGLASRTSPETFVDDFRVNVASAAAAVQAVLPTMRERRAGTILLTGGGLSLDPYPTHASLAIGKAGIRTLALCLAKELGPVGIHVATVTICGLIRPGTPLDADLIAGRYWELHRQLHEVWEPEIVLR